jgi:hypothetical protein
MEITTETKAPDKRSFHIPDISLISDQNWAPKPPSSLIDNKNPFRWGLAMTAEAIFIVRGMKIRPFSALTTNNTRSSSVAQRLSRIRAQTAWGHSRQDQETEQTPPSSPSSSRAPIWQNRRNEPAGCWVSPTDEIACEEHLRFECLGKRQTTNIRLPSSRGHDKKYIGWSRVDQRYWIDWSCSITHPKVLGCSVHRGCVSYIQHNEYLEPTVQEEWLKDCLDVCWADHWFAEGGLQNDIWARVKPRSSFNHRQKIRDLVVSSTTLLACIYTIY